MYFKGYPNSAIIFSCFSWIKNFQVKQKFPSKLILKYQKVIWLLNLNNSKFWGKLHSKYVHFSLKIKSDSREPSEKMNMKYLIFSSNCYKILFIGRIKSKSKHSRTDKMAFYQWNTIEWFLISTCIQSHFSYKNSTRSDLAQFCSCIAQCVLYP